ncbi:unnamed protein product [Gongylonema pulchrum]|uniref:NR LBD domain-containing protein n=1 Tax=Gongylonema pulchrum TaxID=637853 RepID=A0A3P7PRL3_9BILA|nr:unnamed protein product [Gongylonema pulchrum]
MRDRVQETLYQVARETHPAVAPASRFGNLLLLFPSITVTFYQNYLEHQFSGIVDRTIDELVEPLRALKLTDEEAALLKAVIVLNPNLKGLSFDATIQIGELRDRVQETLYQVARETHPAVAPASRFGNLLLLFPSITVTFYQNYLEQFFF